MVDKSRSRKAGGVGLGLALCSRIAEIHGWSLRIESRGGGDAGQCPLLHLLIGGADMAGKILIVDDEQEVLSMLRRYFLLEGYEVITAAGGQEALRKLDGRPHQQGWWLSRRP